MGLSRLYSREDPGGKKEKEKKSQCGKMEASLKVGLKGARHPREPDPRQRVKIVTDDTHNPEEVSGKGIRWIDTVGSGKAI